MELVEEEVEVVDEVVELDEVVLDVLEVVEVVLDEDEVVDQVRIVSIDKSNSAILRKFSDYYFYRIDAC